MEMSIKDFADNINSSDSTSIIKACNEVTEAFVFDSSAAAVILIHLASRLKEICQNRQVSVAENTEAASKIMKAAIIPSDIELRNHWRRVIAAELLPTFSHLTAYTAADETLKYTNILLNTIEEIEKSKNVK